MQKLSNAPRKQNASFAKQRIVVSQPGHASHPLLGVVRKRRANYRGQRQSMIGLSQNFLALTSAFSTISLLDHLRKVQWIFSVCDPPPAYWMHILCTLTNARAIFLPNPNELICIPGLESQSISALNQCISSVKTEFSSETLHLKKILSFILCRFSS